MKTLPNLSKAVVRNKTVIVRTDLNTHYNPKTKKVSDSDRFAAAAKTICYLLKKKARVILLCHQGQKGESDFVSLRQHSKILSRHLKQRVQFVPETVGPKAVAAIQKLQPGQVLLLENVRFLEEETAKGTPEEHAESRLVRTLVPFADLYVNDAFSVSHRNHVSMTGFPVVLPSFTGFRLEKEVLSSSMALNPNAQKTVLLFGGAKIDDNLRILNNLHKKKWNGTVLSTGLLANLLLKAKGIPIGKGSKKILQEHQSFLVSQAKKILKEFGSRILVPVDVAFESSGKRKEIPIQELPVSSPVLDIGSKTIAAYSRVLAKAKTVVIKGPVGMYEKKGFEKGTRQLFKAVQDSKAFSLVGGGDSTSALRRLKLNPKKFSHISLGGGALITLLSDGPMPGIDALACKPILPAERIALDDQKFKKTLDACSKISRAFLSFNANVDYIVRVDKKTGKLAGPFKPKPKLVPFMKKPGDFFSNLLLSMQKGEAMEIGMNEKLAVWLHEHIKPDHKRMGGQVGIMANHLSLLGITPLVSIPFVSREQKQLFRKNTLFWESGLFGGQIKNWKNAERKDPTKINWVFEFSKRQSFLGLRPKRNTRFIASSRLEKFRFPKNNPKTGFDFAILAGFHAAKKKYADNSTYKEQFRNAEKTLQEIKPEQPVHVELGFSPDSGINRAMLRLAGLAESIGLDEQELINCLNVLGYPSLSRKIHKNAVKGVIQGALALQKRLKKTRIFLHSRGYYVAVTPPLDSLSLEQIHQSLDFASIIGAAYAVHEIPRKSEFDLGLHVPVSREGLAKIGEAVHFLRATPAEKEIGIIKRKGFCVVLVPVRMAKKPRKVVGLGDSISSSIVACENALKI